MADDIKQHLIKLIAEGRSNQAYKYLWNQYYDVLLKFSVAYLNSKEMAEEVVSDVFYQVWNAKENIANIKHLRVYLFTAVRNRCYSQIAKQKREHIMFFTTNEFQNNLFFDNELSPERLMITSELSKFIEEIVKDLPPRCRQVYKMIREDGLRNKDVAQQLGISVNTIDVQLGIALKKLTKALQMYDKM